MGCTCFIEYYEGFKDKPDQIIYCPLHKSAPDLYEACKLVLEATMFDDTLPNNRSNWRIIRGLCVKAIAKVEKS